MNKAIIFQIILLFSIGLFEILAKPYLRAFDIIGGMFIGFSIGFLLLEIMDALVSGGE